MWHEKREKEHKSVGSERWEDRAENGESEQRNRKIMEDERGQFSKVLTLKYGQFSVKS